MNSVAGGATIRSLKAVARQTGSQSVVNIKSRRDLFALREERVCVCVCVRVCCVCVGGCAVCCVCACVCELPVTSRTSYRFLWEVTLKTGLAAQRLCRHREDHPSPVKIMHHHAVKQPTTSEGSSSQGKTARATEQVKDLASGSHQKARADPGYGNKGRRGYGRLWGCVFVRAAGIWDSFEGLLHNVK